MDAERAIIDLIDGNDGWVRDTNLLRGPMQADEAVGAVVPREAVFVLETGGREPINAGSGAASPQYYEIDVQVILRGEPDKYGATRTKARTIYALLHDQAPSGYTYCRAISSIPEPLGQDERRSYLFVVNLRLTILE